jgi:hypothetical protein
MKTIKLSIFLLLTFMLSACLKDSKLEDFSEGKVSALINVRVTIPQGYDFSPAGRSVLLRDPNTGLQFSGVTDAQGLASIRVAFGSYIAVSEFTEIMEDQSVYIFNGTTERMRVTPNDPNVLDATLPMNVSKTGQIIIKEFYYGGCLDPATSKSYTKDQYILLYNNSDRVAYLDSLCIGVAHPYNAPTNGRLSDWVKPGTSELRDSVPNITFGWLFPGNGTQYPLQPGEEAVVSLNAINHKASVTSSVNLGKPGYWAMYDPILTRMHSAPEAGVNIVDCYWKMGSATSFVVSTLSPALFIYRMGGKSAAQFIEDTYTLHPNTPNNRNTDVLMIDKELIIDGVECFRSVTDTKRLRPEIDNGFAMTPGSGQGYSVHRKIDEAATAKAGGRIVYQDTNNSSNDFEVRPTASLLNK